MKRFIVYLLVILMAGFTCFAQAQKEAAPEEVVEGRGTAENPVTITCVIKDLGDYLEMLDHMETELAKDEIFVNFEPVQIQEGSYSDAMGLLLQGGTIPDLMYFQGGDYQFAITQGILEDMNPYIENSKYLKDALDSHSFARLENYPYLLWVATPRNKVPLIRQDWFNQLQTADALMANPTIENYYAFFKEIQTKFTNGEVITCQGASDGLTEIDMMFGQAFGNTTSWVKNSDGNYIYKNVSAGELEKLEFYAKLYKEGILDNEYQSKKYSAKEQDFYKGIAGVVLGTQNTVVPKYETKMIAANGEQAALVALPPAKGEDGVCIFAPVAVDKETRGWAISKFSAHKQLVFDILDWLAGGRGAMLDQYGYEGVSYEITADNKLNILDTSWWPRFHETIKNFDPKMEYQDKLPLFAYPIMKEATQMASEHTALDNAFMIPEELVTEWDAATIVYKEFAADFVSGKKTATDWEAFVSEWYDMGGKAVTDYANEVLK